VSEALIAHVPVQTLARAWGSPVLQAGFKEHADDFHVEEVLGFIPDGTGEHLFVEIEKTGLTTFEAQSLLARHFGLHLRNTAFAGMKDKLGVTRQWFSLHLGPRADAPEDLQHPQLRILQSERNSRKLKRGSHRGNRFRIVLRKPQGDRAAITARLQTIATCGVPNYFGEQRFGRNGANTARALAWFNGGATPGREERSLLLSAARSCLFNACLAVRVADGTWNRCIEGDVLALAGTGSCFASARETPDAVQKRLDAFDLHPTGPLWGRGDPRTLGAALALEMAVAAQVPALAAGLARQGLEQERRPLRMQVTGLQSSFEPEGLVLDFVLARGCYATTVLRELLGTEVE